MAFNKQQYSDIGITCTTCFTNQSNKNINWPNTYLFGLVRPVISPIAVESEIFAGESVQLFCTVARGDLPISSAWLFNGEHLPMNTMTQVGPRTLLLVIHEATAWHSGNYTCIAENPAGITESTIPVLIHGIAYCMCMIGEKIMWL